MKPFSIVFSFILFGVTVGALLFMAMLVRDSHFYITGIIIDKDCPEQCELAVRNPQTSATQFCQVTKSEYNYFKAGEEIRCRIAP